MSKAIRITPLRYAILTILRDALNPMSVASIYAAEPANHDFRSVENIAQAIPPLNDAGLVEPFKLARGYAYRITEQGRAALEGLADPGIDPGHIDEAEPEEEEETEEEIDFALWASGVLQIQIGDNSFTVPAAKVPLLKRYLDEQHRAIEQIERDTGFFKQLYDIKVAELVASIITQVEKASRQTPETSFTVPVPAAPPAPEPDTIADAIRAADAEYHAKALSDIESLREADRPRSMPCASFPGTLTAFDRLGTPAIGTEAIGRPEVNLDGPNGVGGTASPREELSHGMTREEQFAETAGRG